MAGKKGRSGRKRKPTSLHIAQGTHRADRHGEIGSEPDIAKGIIKPDFACPYASALWDEQVQATIEGGFDQKTYLPKLRMLCETWGLYVMSYEIALHDPTDKDARIAVSTYRAGVSQLASDFGWDPASITKLHIEKPKKPGIAPRKRG